MKSIFPENKNRSSEIYRVVCSFGSKGCILDDLISMLPHIPVKSISAALTKFQIKKVVIMPGIGKHNTVLYSTIRYGRSGRRQSVIYGAEFYTKLKSSLPDNLFKFCPKCKKHKATNNFFKSSSWCKKCSAESSNKWHKKHPEYDSIYSIKRNLRRGTTLSNKEIPDELVEIQILRSTLIKLKEEARNGRKRYKY